MDELQRKEIGTNEENDVIKQDLIVDELVGARVISDLIDVNKVFGCTDAKTLKLQFAKEYLHHYLYLDGANRAEGADGNTYIKWNLNYGPPIYAAGIINVNKPIENIVAVECYSMMYADRFYGDRVHAPIDEAYDTIINFNSGTRYRINVGIDELSGQGCFMENGKFQFTMSKKDSTYIPNNIRFDLFKKIYTINSITVRLFDPTNPVIFDVENMQMQNLQAGTPTLRLQGDHRLTTQAITISGFTTADPVLNAALISSVNRTLLPISVYPTYPYTYSIVSDNYIQITGASTGSLAVLPGTQYVNMYVDGGFSMAIKVICAK